MEYEFEITETLSRQIKIQSFSAEDAYRSLKELYRKEAIVLDASDFIDVEFIHLRPEDTGKECLLPSYKKIFPYFKLLLSAKQ